MPSPIAFVMLLIWPFVVWQMFRRLPPAKALIWALLAGYLLLPPLVKFDLPLIPDLDKFSIPSLTAAFCVVFLLRDRVALWPESRWGRAMILLFVLGPLGTVLTNTDAITLELGQINGMKVYDSASAAANQAIWLIPMLLGRKYLGTPEGLRILMGALIAGGLVYSAPMLLESRISPQLNVWVYGFFQHEFAQAMRQGGFRPFVFLPHGLWVALFTLMCLMSALIVLRTSRAEDRPKALLIAGWLAVMLIICKSTGVLVYGLLFCPLILLVPPRLQLAAAAAVAGVVIAYPLLRGLHVVPLDAILDMAMAWSPERHQSLQYRITNEEILLAKAEMRPLFGWGGFGRNFTHDPVTGQLVTVADGAWIIVLGMFGWVGYIANFGLTALPLLLLGREALALRRVEITRITAGMALVLAVSLVDMLPNATQVPVTWLIVGALLGEAERLRALRLAAQDQAFRRGLHAPGRGRTVI